MAVTTIEEWKVDAWARNVTHLAQQMSNKLMGTTREESAAPGKRLGWDRIAAMTGERGRPSRYAPTPNISSVESRRWANPVPWRFGKLIDVYDKLESLHMPENEYAMAAAADRNRFMDELIIGRQTGTAFTDLVGGALGTADEGEDTLVTVAYDTTDQLIVDGGANLTKGKLLQGLEKFGEADYDPVIHGELVMVYSPHAIVSLHDDTTLTSLEHTGLAALRRREPVPGLLGYTRWIQHTGLPKVGDVRRCFAYAGRSLGLGHWLDEKRRLEERTDLSHTPQLYMEMSMGAVRIDDKLVVAIDIDETV